MSLSYVLSALKRLGMMLSAADRSALAQELAEVGMRFEGRARRGR